MFLEVASPFCVAGAGNSAACKIRGRRRSSWGLQKRWQAWGIWRGSETMHFAWQAQWFRALWCRCLKPPTLNPWKGCIFHVTEVLLCSDHFAWQLRDFVYLGSTFSWQAQYFWSIHLKITKTYWNSEVKCLLNMSILKEVSQKSFVFELQSFIFEGSLAQKFRFWASKLHFWRKSRTKASFFELQSFNFEGSLAQKLRFWASKLHFWRKSRTKASFFELQSFNFEGSLAQKLRFWASKLHFWRKSRTKASFFELQRFNFEGSLAQKLRFWASKFKASFLTFDIQIIWISKQQTTKISWSTYRLTTKSFESQINWQPNQLNLKSDDNQITWISNQLTTESLESQSIDNHITWSSNQQTTKIIWSTHRLTTKSFESQINWQPNQLNFKSDDNQIIWLSTRWIWHQLTFEPIELRTLPSYRFLIFGNFRHRLVR